MSLKSLFSSSGSKELSEQEKWDALQKAQATAHDRLFTAIRKEDIAGIDKILAEYPAAKDWKDKDTNKGLPLLHYALQENSLKSFTHLLDIGIHPEQSHEYVYKTELDFVFLDKYRDNFNVLSAACLKHKKDFVFACLQRSERRTYDVNYYARRKPHPDIENYLSRAAEIRAEYVEKKKLEDALAVEKKAEEKLQDKQDDLNATKKAFFAAIKSADLVTLEKTVQTHPEAFDWQEEKTGLECLFYAMEVKNLDSFRALILLGADVNKKRNIPEDGAYPVHFATEKNDDAFLTALIQRGADTSEKCGWFMDAFHPDCGRHTATEIAQDRGYKKIIGILNNAEKIRADFLAAHQEELAPKKPAPIAPVAATAKPAAPDPLETLMQEFNAMKKKQSRMEEELAATREELSKTQQELNELKDPGVIVKLPNRKIG